MDVISLSLGLSGGIIIGFFLGIFFMSVCFEVKHIKKGP